MKTSNRLIDYWFTVEPYVYVRAFNDEAILYNTLDGVTIRSDKVEVIELLRDMLQKENCGVVFLENDRYEQKNINSFIQELREKYMGDVIDVTLSKGKPVQLLPFFNLSAKHELYRKHNFSRNRKILEYLCEISIHVDHTTNIANLISFLQTVSGNLIFNIIGNLRDVINYDDLLSFLNQYPTPKKIICPYSSIISLQPAFEHNFSYKISVRFPIDIQQWNCSRQILLDQALPVEYVFDVTSDEDILQAEEIIEQFQIGIYRLNPVYTGKNIHFFEENVFLTSEDILSTSMSIKDFFANQSMNVYDFGKINIMTNGDAYANVNLPKLGNIYTHSIHEIVYKEIEEGKSWLRIRNQEPCSNCIYQWFCPSPSSYELAIGRPNLCHVKQEKTTK